MEGCTSSTNVNFTSKDYSTGLYHVRRDVTGVRQGCVEQRSENQTSELIPSQLVNHGL
eukprot:XP_001706281.1 Hypothetical protein GL50803_39726 [Giardia lamblia ATCC 50803]